MDTDSNPAIVNYKCPNCGGALEFVIKTQRWDCKYCGASFSLEELTNAIEKTSDKQDENLTEKPVLSTERFTDEEVVVYHCPDCGGQVLTDINTVATFCTFCHNPAILSGKLTGQYKPAQLIPFKITKEEALAKLEEMIKKKPLLPKIFRDCVEKGEISGLYVPYWLFSADADVKMSLDASRVTHWSDASYNYTKTDKYIVDRAGVVPIRKLPVDASVRLDDFMMDSVEPFDYTGLVPFSLEYLSGHFAENFDVTMEDSKNRFISRSQSAASEMLKETVRGYTYTSVLSFSCNFLNTEAVYSMLPIWTIAVKHGGKIYSYVVNGQTGKSVGKLPMSVQRLIVFLLGGTVGITLIVTLLRQFVLGV